MLMFLCLRDVVWQLRHVVNNTLNETDDTTMSIVIMIDLSQRLLSQDCAAVLLEESTVVVEKR